MHNLSDDELDRLSREAADQHSMPPGEAAWDKISARLDREMPEGPGFNFHVFPDMALLLLLFIGLPVFYSASDKQPAISIQQQAKSTSDETSPAEADKTSVSANQTPSVSATTKSSSDLSKPQPAAAQGIGDAGKRSALPENKKTTEFVQQGAGSGNLTAKNNRNKSDGKLAGSGNDRMSESGVAIAPSTDENNADVTVQHNSSGKAEQTNIIVPGNRQPEYPGVIRPLHGSAVMAAPAKPETTESKATLSPELKAAIDEQLAADKKIKDKKSQDQRMNMFEFGVVWSPDFSRVGSGPVSTMGHIAGFVAAYNFNKRWSVNTGILYSNKNYQAVENGYSNIPGYPAYDPFVKVKKVEAECLMWDLPVNVRYNFYWRPKQRAFASTGLSSYFMKQEGLKYWYTYYNNPRYKEWVNENKSSYWFAVVNLSAGFEQQIFQGFTVQAEPFVKLSMRDIGYGKINLKSYGVFLGLKYTPPVHRIKK